MPRPARGSVVERKTKSGTVYALRFRPPGYPRQYVTLGGEEEGYTRAEAELRHTMADLERGQWRPPDPEAVQPQECPTFHQFATDWFEANKPGWAERTIADYQWALSHHLLPHFAKHRLTEITIEEVDRYRAAMLAGGEAGAGAINKTLKRLSQILEVAEEYGHIDRNPARGKRRRVKAPKVQCSWVEPEQAPRCSRARRPTCGP
jgi:integrase